ncbi:RNA polymerase sigma-70 factor [Streptomyces sp. TLI_55]|uniref:sigma factor-like helix-turn-helix DNA-binding protein n=1 Tax=Streptomyces sp. TLI_55 TaxID=1938861 RepID=UPI000BC853D3|nr:sigma factor-like helix-turn-helix DNA-binding protein [Streptomyces sp. TLI_55]SNX88187.1 RNA polymerase sigma-70 factor [Streptomyces sp. TLI_55]
MNRIEEFEQARPLLLSIARRFLGRGHKAEDAVHETWLCYETQPAQAPSDRAFLSATVARISLDMLQPRRPEHPPPQPAPSPSAAAVALLEGLPPLERAVFVLREIFGCGPPEIAAALGRTQAACDRLAAAVPRAGDGRGTNRWPGRIEGAEAVARALAAIGPSLTRIAVTMEPQQVGRRPGAVFRDREGTVLCALAFDVLEGRIQTIRWLTRPYTCPSRPTPAP